MPVLSWTAISHVLTSKTLYTDNRNSQETGNLMSNEFGIQLEPFTNILPGQKLKGNRNPLLKSNKFGKPKSMLVADPGKM